MTAHHLASQVGLDVLRQGGNAVDAAVAVGYALAVTLPGSGNIGGGGFMLIRMADGRNVFISFREKAGVRATKDMFGDASGDIIGEMSTDSWLAIGVPGTVKGLEHARETYGTMSREALMAPAIALARTGFVLEPGDDILNVPLEAFRAEENLAAIFLKEGERYQPGDRIVQEALASTLQNIADSGPDAFYNGPIADAIVAAMQANGGILGSEDFESYTVHEYEPVTCDYRGYRIISAPPPSSGGTILCEMLNVLEGYPVRDLGFNSAPTLHMMAEAMRFAYVDRNTYLGDPEYVDNPLDDLLSKAHAEQIRAHIDPSRATPSLELAPAAQPLEGTNTTHYSILDARGNAVAVTYTLNLNFGAKKIAGDTGFLLNNELDDFTFYPGVPNAFGLVQGEANTIAPMKTPLSSMTPTVITKDGEIFLVVGSPGGSRIITVVLQVILNVIDHGMSLQEAIDAPRIHHQWLPDVLYVEHFGISPETRATLEAMGHWIQEEPAWGAVEAVLKDPSTGTIFGATDGRRSLGAAFGY